MLDKGFKIVNEILLRYLHDATDMSEEDRILVFYASIANWCRKNSSQAIRDFTVYDFVNRDQTLGSAGSITVHFLGTQINLSDWDFELLTAYFKAVRPAFLHRSTHHPSERRVMVFGEFDEFTSRFFVNSTGKHDMKASNIVLQFVDKIKSSVELPNPRNITVDSQLPTIGGLRR